MEEQSPFQAEEKALHNAEDGNPGQDDLVYLAETAGVRLHRAEEDNRGSIHSFQNLNKLIYFKKKLAMRDRERFEVKRAKADNSKRYVCLGPF